MSAARLARVAFALLAWLLVGLIIVQIYLAGAAVRQLGGSDNFDLHRDFALILFVVMIAQLLLAFAGRMGWRMIGGSALIVILLVVQSALVRIGSPGLAAVHPLNGFLISLIALWIAWRSLGYVRAPLPVEHVHATAVPATAGTAAAAVTTMPAASPALSPAAEAAAEEKHVPRPEDGDDQ
jgi:hypothetical protein